jgi:hypothetical protein
MPIMLEITSAVALTTPNWRSKAGFAGGEATFAFILILIAKSFEKGDEALCLRALPPRPRG